MDHSRSILRQRLRRRHRVRRFIRGTAERPRLSVFRTHKHIYAQVIDDASGRTLASASSMDKQLRSGIGFGGNKQAAEAIGRADRKSTRLNSSHVSESRMPSSA